MSDVKHTPGPWKWTVIGENLMSLDGPVISYAGYEGMWLSRYDEGEDAANARLIAAAPELLEALEKWVELIERTRKTQSLFIKIEANSAADFMQGLEETRAAIAKAKGKA